MPFYASCKALWIHLLKDTKQTCIVYCANLNIPHNYSSDQTGDKYNVNICLQRSFRCQCVECELCLLFTCQLLSLSPVVAFYSHWLKCTDLTARVGYSQVTVHIHSVLIQTDWFEYKSWDLTPNYRLSWNLITLHSSSPAVFVRVYIDYYHINFTRLQKMCDHSKA